MAVITMLEMYKRRMSYQGDTIGQALKKQSDSIMNQTFTRDINYRKAKLYNQNHEFLEEVEIKFQKKANYSISGDSVDFWVQFRPLYRPEKKYCLYESDKDDNGNIINERLGFYIDIADDTGQEYTWIIVGKSEDNQFVLYNVLKCNWTFKWIVDGVIKSCLGVLRYANSYNSGEWSDGFVTSVQNQTRMWMPTNADTETIDYNQRFIIADRKNNPPTWHVSKIEDLYPMGVTKFVLSQDHFDPKKDNAELKITDYYSSEITPIEDEKGEVHEKEENTGISYSSLQLNSSKPTLVLGGSKKSYTITYFNQNNEEVKLVGETRWTITGEKDNTIYTYSELSSLLEISVSEDTNTVSIKINKNKDTFALVGTVITIAANLGIPARECIGKLEVTTR